MAKQAQQVGDESFCRGMKERGLELSHLTPCWTSQYPVLRRDSSQSAHILQQTQCKSNSWLYLPPASFNAQSEAFNPWLHQPGRLRTWLTGS